MKEYRTINEISGPLVFAEIDEPIGYDEIVEIEMPNGEVKNGQVLETAGDLVSIQVMEGTEGIADPDSLAAELPLQPGDLLDLSEFVASAETVVEALRGEGHAYADVLRNYAVDTVQDRATVWLAAVPGPRVMVDSILTDGLEELGREDVLRQLTFEDGDLLRLRELRESQRNLYDLDIVRFASVAVAPDSLQLSRDDSTQATVRVALSEAPEHVIEGQAGWGSVECFRAQAEWTDRWVLGGARNLRVSGSLSRIGLGEPLSGLGSLCPAGQETELSGDRLDYRLATDFTQPHFLSSRNQLTAGAYAERQSEPGLYRRTAYGGQVTVARRSRSRDRYTVGLAGEYRDTEAVPILYCFEFRACSAEEVDRLRGARTYNALSLSWTRDRTNATLDPTSGYTLRSTADWTTPLLFSDFEFLRATAEAAVYRSVGGGWVIAGFARPGSFLTRASLGPRDFIPPEERFFTGGAGSVRGYDRHGLGPGLYLVDNEGVDPDSLDPTGVADSLAVDFFPTGGTSVGVASVEARFPSPVLRDLVRLAVFVDAGTVSLEPVWEMNSEWRITPGAGLRIQTPVGPIRVDLGYNPNPPPTAALYATEAGQSGDLVRIADEFTGADPTFWERLTLHIAVGQAF
ncbi:MAG: BamA/TamA family outer membrane protein [Gemmatimonadota bacterium]